MTPAEFRAERQRHTRPRTENPGSHTGGLIPTDSVEDDEVSFPAAPEKSPPPEARRGVEDAAAEAGEEPVEPEFSADVAEGDDEADRMLLRLFILNTFGSPIKNCHVAVVQDGGQAQAWASDVGMAEFLIVRPRRTPSGEQESKEIAESAEGRLVAPPAPAPAPGRTPHVDVQVSRGGLVLKRTRLYFRDIPENTDDAHYNGTRIIAEAGADHASYDVVIDTGNPRD